MDGRQRDPGGGHPVPAGQAPQLVDRRFYRQRYDAVGVVNGFSARLRDRVHLDVLENELLGVVEETMQPTCRSLWLRRSAVAAEAPAPQPSSLAALSARGPGSIAAR
jgi:hypothetical protein